jgi:hypothetical protein
MKRAILGAALALTSAVYLGPAAQACDTLIVWQADLTAATTPLVTPNMSSSVPSAAPNLGTATVQFDFVNPGATFRVETKTPGDVEQIALHVTRTFSSSTGPALFTLYSAAADGPLPAVFTKRVADADLQKQPSLKIVTLADAVRAVLDGRTYVTVTPKATPHAPPPIEIAGFITMRKDLIYSDKPGDAQHDPALHHAALVAATSH